MADHYWSEVGKGWMMSQPILVWHTKPCKHCGLSAYTYEVPIVFFIRNGITQIRNSKGAKRINGVWCLERDKGSGVFNKPLPRLRPKPVLLCQCIAQGSKPSVREVSRYLLPPTPTPRTPDLTQVLENHTSSFTEGQSDSRGTDRNQESYTKEDTQKPKRERPSFQPMKGRDEDD